MAKTNLNFDILIIGSGAGGGAVASVLAPLCESGARIGILEWGGKFSPANNSRREVEMASKYYFDMGGFQTTTKDLTLAFAKAVGGSTTVYTGTSLKAPSRVFEKWNVPGINLQDLNPRYDKYIKQNNVHLLTSEEINENNKLFYQACKKLGWAVEQFPVNVKDCQGLGTCNLGCASGAKQGTAAVQIPAAQKKGVELFPFCKVEKIEGEKVYTKVLPAEFELGASNLEPGEYVFNAKKIVVCGGAIHTPALLMRSLRKSSFPALGKYFTCHPALILAGLHESPIQNIQGHPKSYFCEEFLEEKHFLLETCIYFPFIFAKSLVGFGKPVDEMLSQFNKIQMILALISDEAEEHNRVDIDSNGNPRVHYKYSNRSIDAFLESVRASARILFAAGAKKVHAPGSKSFFLYPKDEINLNALVSRSEFKLGKVSISAAHLMGGCRMGTDPKNSVTDSWGKVHGTENLYVADASLFPESLEINPYLTIMALADRVASGILTSLS